MKVLDVSPFQDGLRRNIMMLDRLGNEMESIHKSVEGLVGMEDVLKGEGGNAIRAFYADCHLPFLQFFMLFQGRFTTVLKQMVAALDTLEPDSSGYIQEHFLESDIEQGLRHIAQLTGSLTDEANSIMNQVSDIVSLPHLDDSEVQYGVRDATIKRDATVTQLHEFDANQTTALTPIAQDLLTMETWISDIEGLFQAGVGDINFVSSQWNVLTFKSEIRTELFPKVYLNPSDLWIQEQEQLIGTMITAATFQTLEGKKVTTIEENPEKDVKYYAYENGLLIKEYVVGQTTFYEVVSKVEYKEESVQVDKPKENKVLNSFQFVLDIAGLVPIIGEAADGVNGVIYAARGDTVNAALSFGAMIPIAGWASTGGKLALKGNDLNKGRKVVSSEKAESIYSPVYQDVVNSPLGKTQNQLDLLSSARYQVGTPNAFTFNTPSAKTDIPTNINSGDVKVKGTDEAANSHLSKSSLVEIESFKSSGIYRNLLNKYNITQTELHVLVMSNVNNLTDVEKVLLKSLRDAVPAPTPNTILQKVISVSDIDNYLRVTDPYTTIGGFITKAEDVKHLSNTSDIFDGLRLDYPGTKFTKDVDYAVIRYKTDEVTKLEIPYSNTISEVPNAKTSISYPLTGNGFTSARDGSLIPEYEASSFMKPRDGAELYKVVNGNEKLIGVYDDTLGRFRALINN